MSDGARSAQPSAGRAREQNSGQDAVIPLHGWRVQCVDSEDGLLALQGDWHELERLCGTDLPFQTWERCTRWWKHFREDRLAVRDSLRVCVVRNGAEVVAIAPFILTERPAAGPLRARSIQLMGADPNITEIHSVLCRPEYVRECYTALLEHFAATDDEWDWIAWEAPVDASAALADDRTDRERFLHKAERPAFVLTLAPTWNQFLAGLHRSIRGLVRKYYRDLAAAGLDAHLEVVDNPTAIGAALDDFYRLYAAREMNKGSRGQVELFASPQTQAFLTDTCTQMGRRGVTRVFRLWAGDNLVATRIGFQLGGRLYLYYSGWDPMFSRYSVMTVLVAEVIQFAIGQGLKSVHLSTGRDLSKTRWSPTEVRYRQVIQLANRPSAPLVHRAHDAVGNLCTSKLASWIIPARLARRSGHGTPHRSPLMLRSPVHRLHGLAAAAAALVGFLDLLDGRLDHMVWLLPPGIH